MASPLISFALLGSLLCCCSAYSYFRDNIPNGYNVEHPCKSNTQWFGVGHLQEQGGGARNQFGKDFFSAGKTWTRDLCMKDSDGDSQTNGAELGDPLCVWTKGSTPSRTTGITHPGVKTPTGSFSYDPNDTSTISCNGTNPNCTAKFDPDVKTMDLTMAKGTKVPSKTTTYYCTTFKVPEDLVYHAIAFDAILDNLNVIHHMLLYGCTSGDVSAPGECDMSGSGCRDLLAIWSLGLPDQCLPEAAGVRFGKGTYKTFQLQVHWNNPLHRTDYTDQSGLRIHYTSKLRQNDMGILWLGQLHLNIPARMNNVTHLGHCSSECTKGILTRPITVTASHSHMHLTGKSTRITHHVAQSKTSTDILSQPVYDYDSPQWTHHQPAVTVRPGDGLTIRCTFDTSGRSTVTTFGDGTNDEMCFGFLQYYPKGGDLQCTQREEKSLCFEQSIVCGNKCPLSTFFADISVTLAEANAQCTATMCNDQCLLSVRILTHLYNDQCVKVRHPTQYRAFLSDLVPQSSKLLTAYAVCTAQHGHVAFNASLTNVTFDTPAEISVSCPASASSSSSGERLAAACSFVLLYLIVAAHSLLL